MKTKELATDELLKIATPRPWKCNVTDAKSGAYTFSQADAHLLVRATNSFEAMREAINGLMRHCVTVKGFPDKDKGRTEEQQRAFDAAKNALALAEGKAVQS